MENGLSTQDVKALLQKYGPNQIPEENNSLILKLLHKFISPISLMLFAAALLTLFIGKVFDFYFILILLFLNIFIVLWQENKADDAIKKLNEHLAQRIKVLRDGSWQETDSKYLVPGDVVKLTSGEVIPTDGTIIDAQHISINDSVLTGESLPKEKKEGDLIYSGSFLVAGLAVMKVTATGKETSFGKTVFSVETLRKKSLLEKDVLDISKFLTLLSLVAVVILTAVTFNKVSLVELLTLDLSLLIAGIPISLPTVMTLIIEFGILVLAKKNAIVRRLSSLEDLANVNFLLTDKTGTLTKNEISIKDIYTYSKFTPSQVVLFASLATGENDSDLVDLAIINKAKEMRLDSGGYRTVDFNPADSVRKRSTAVLEKEGQKIVISFGAPQVILSLCKISKEAEHSFIEQVGKLALQGSRSLAVAMGEDQKEEGMELVGLVALSDTLRDDAKAVLEFLMENGIGVAMVTGDNRAIAAQISSELSLKGEVMTKKQLDKLDWDSEVNRDFFNRVGAFAEILPEDKFKLVQKAKQFFTVASNGDGVNDLPALKAANVGIAVKSAVSALKGTADIVLLTNGISVIRDAIIESRKIFARLYTYSLYRISESLRLIVTITTLGILYRVYPLTPLQIIVVALLNDIPIISLATDRVKIVNRPAKINVKKRFTLSSLYGVVGILNSLILFFIVRNILNLPWETIQTMYFLKLTVSGHMLIYVAHTKERWFKFLPSKEVIWATSLTQLAATFLALTGFLMPSKIPFSAVLFVWLWSFFWMQIGELMKILQKEIAK